jgi:hypothetical protein
LLCKKKKPYTAALATYKIQPLPQGTFCNVAVFEASDPQCDPDEAESITNPCVSVENQTTPPPFVPAYSLRSKNVQPPATSLPFQLGTQNLQMEIHLGFFIICRCSSCGTFITRRLCYLQKVNFGSNNKSERIKKVFGNILRIETNIDTPQSNLYDVAEQLAEVYLIDPDKPRSFETKY